MATACASLLTEMLSYYFSARTSQSRVVTYSGWRNAVGRICGGWALGHNEDGLEEDEG